ncbi:acylneuraminate cytidylyltransferase [Microbacterium halophytorum]|uniref:acylneuraminate cytidylyltransferase n=1 Tax=Microbacterium halophytorum TaxID=2067568 RepID=UPI001E56701E|nr:acylneuraminate cytidylyltransferase [Microbacterium halophytorum]
MTREAVAIIPARGGSVGVPRKNVARVGGIPLVARAVRAAHAAGIARAVVSTDDDEIAAVASEWGAEVVRRPAELASGTATSESAVLHALDALADRGIDVGVVAFLQATSPFQPVGALAEAVSRVSDGSADCVFSARESFEFFWADDGGAARAVGHDRSHRPRRQDREPLYVETGAFYVFGASGFRRARHRFFGHVEISEVPAAFAVEVDTPAELRAARALAPLHVDAAVDRMDVDAVVTDFDGVHTDDTATISADGTEHVRVSRSDGMGVRMLREAGVKVLILSTETNPVVAARADKLGVDVIQACGDKRAALEAWAAREGILMARIAYVGNDVNDLGALEAAGWPVVVPGSHPRALESARVVLAAEGGRGAVRELAERVLADRAASQDHSRGERV